MICFELAFALSRDEPVNELIAVELRTLCVFTAWCNSCEFSSSLYKNIDAAAMLLAMQGRLGFFPKL